MSEQRRLWRDYADIFITFCMKILGIICDRTMKTLARLYRCAGYLVVRICDKYPCHMEKNDDSTLIVLILEASFTN